MPEFIGCDKTILIQECERYAYFSAEKTLVYKMPYGFIADEIIGTRTQFDDDKKMEDFYLLRASLKNIEIVLYDEIYASLSNLRNSELTI